MADDFSLRVVSLAGLIGATEEPSVQQLTLYIPHKNKEGKTVENIYKWIREAQRLLSIIGGGTTTMPPADGTWLKRAVDNMEELKDEDVVWEKTTVMYAYIYPDRFEKNLKSLREFLHGFGRETNQGEVVFEFAGEFFRIRKYDSE